MGIFPHLRAPDSQRRRPDIFTADQTAIDAYLTGH